MSRTVGEASQRYYCDLADRGDFESVPMADDLLFRGPLHAYADGVRYRRDCVERTAKARSLVIRYQFIDADEVHTVYHFDLGLPGGPIASSETLRFDNEVMVQADLLIDTTPLRATAPSS